MDGYRIVKNLGFGSFGDVYLCERRKHENKLVLKEVKIDARTKNLQAAKNEVDILKHLEHPNVIKFYRHFLWRDKFCIFMEYAENGTLQELISQKRHTNHITQNVVLTIFGQILLGLDYIHSKNVVHRDLKTENILLSGQKQIIVKIADFGISKTLMGDSKASTVIGTTNYLAPEICEEKPYDIKTDIWSLGCILYEMCALQRMFDGSMKQIIMSITHGILKVIDFGLYSHEIQDLIEAMLTVNPHFRPTTQQIINFPVVVPVLLELYTNLGMIGM